MDHRYREKRLAIERLFVPENRVPDSTTLITSPSGNYNLEICQYRTGAQSWNYSRGIIKATDDSRTIADIKRNYGHFWYSWVEHANGNEYLLCGEDYQGYCVINLSLGTQHIHFPERGHQGYGFCWIAVYPSPDTLMLAVDGCYWACPYELVLYDFREPDKLPLTEIERFGPIDDSKGWVDNNTFVAEQEIAVRKSDGMPYNMLSPEEKAELNKNADWEDYRTEAIYYKRPDFPSNE